MNRERKDFCYYCGNPSEETDHVIPKSKLRNVKKDNRRTIIMECCKECNHVLYNYDQDTL